MGRLFFRIVGFLLLSAFSSVAQSLETKDHILDSLYILETEEQPGPDKVLHAEPLFIDLIRDLGARKGEREWNVGMGLTDNGDFDQYSTLVEYEWAPVNRLGLEVELPFSFYYPINGNNKKPSNSLNSLKMAAQYSFYVSEKKKLSLAIGGIHEFLLTDFNRYGQEAIYRGNVYNPFFIAAKRWGSNFHTLIYTGPQIKQQFNGGPSQSAFQINTNFHYMIPGTRNFVGIECNKIIENGDLDLTIRPQMRLGVADNLLIGIVTGIPISRENERFSTFFRIIYEPKHHSSKPKKP